MKTEKLLMDGERVQNLASDVLDLLVQQKDVPVMEAYIVLQHAQELLADFLESEGINVKNIYKL